MVKRKKTKQKKGQNRSTQGLGNLGRFVQFLTYKAKLVGKSVIRITKNTQLRNVVIMGKSMICLLGSVLWFVIAGAISIWIGIVLSFLCYVFYCKMPYRRAINNLLIIFDNTEFSMDLKFDNRWRDYSKEKPLPHSPLTRKRGRKERSISFRK